MAHFVIQEHRKRRTVHFDLMLERGGKLATWSWQGMPSFKSPLVVAEKLPDHRRAYLVYEGKISRGRGQVAIRDKGRYLVEAWWTNLIIISLRGKKMRGRFLLLRSLRSPAHWWIIPIKRD